MREDLSVRQVTGDYEVLGFLGEGGMGQVYEVRNLISHRVEAMKILSPNLPEAPDTDERFLEEIRICASLNHPNIAGLHTAQRAGGRLLMILEYLDGETLASLLRKKRLPLEKCIDFMIQASAALSYAHARGIVHRDVKPANMFVTRDGTLKLMDFGIAKMAGDTDTGSEIGSLNHISPEQIKGGPADGRSDIYSLGVTLYELLTGQYPFNLQSPPAVFQEHLGQAPKKPSEIVPSLPRALDALVLRVLAKDPEDRFQTAEAFSAALESVCAGQSRSSSSARFLAEASRTFSEKGTKLFRRLAGSVASARNFFLIGA